MLDGSQGFTNRANVWGKCKELVHVAFVPNAIGQSIVWKLSFVVCLF
jgi:hypothetical protein